MSPQRKSFIRPGPKTRLQLIPPEQFSEPVSEAVAKIRVQIVEDLLSKTDADGNPRYTRERAEELAAIRVRPDIILTATGRGVRWSDLPGGKR